MGRSNAKGLHIKPIAHPILIPLILLTIRDLQPRIPLLPLRQECTTAILSYKLIFTHLLRLALKLIVFVASVQIRLSAVGLTSLAKLTQSKEAIRSKLVNLHIKLLQHFTKKPNRGKAKAVGKVILEDNSIILTRHRDRLALRKLSPTLRNLAILLKFKDHLLRHERRPKILGLAGHDLCFFSTNQISK
jgi:hypothetical protein